MQTKFKNLIEFMQIFSSDDICRKYFEKQRWNGKPVCPKCGNNKKNYSLGKTGQYKCSNKECYKKFTVTVGTVFESGKVPLVKWFAAMYLVSAHKKGISSLQLHRDLEVTQKTAWFMIMRIREMLKENSPQALNNVVEADESYYGGAERNKHANKKSKGTQGRNTVTKTPIFGLLERKGKVIVAPVSDVKGETLKSIINSNVSRNATIVTDEWHAYNGLSVNFNHLRVEHGKGEYVNGEAHTNSLEGFWSLLKRGINGIQHSVSKKHLHRYCTEYQYRYNSRLTQDTERFTTTLSHSEGRLTYKNLIN